jgi:hypothetical protein
MDLIVAKVLRFEGLQEVLILGYLVSRRKRHAKALVNMIKIAQPPAPGTLPRGIAADINRETR